MLFSLALLAVAVIAAPVKDAPKVFKVPLKYHHNVTSIKKLATSRYQNYNTAGTAGTNGFYGPAVSGGAINEDANYVAVTTIGGKSWNLVVDTGSSNTWCGARASCEPSSSGSSTGNSFRFGYGDGSTYATGTEYNDYVNYAGAQAYTSIGAASSTVGFSGFYYLDGIFGFGPVELTQNTVSNTYQVPTWMDNLYSNSQIPTEVLGIYFKPESGSDTNDNNGELTIGGTDSSKYSGSIQYIGRITTGVCANFWGVAINRFQYGSFVISNGAGSLSAIVDTGTTFIYIPTSVFNYFLSITGGSKDPTYGLASWPASNAPQGSFTTVLANNILLTLSASQWQIPTSQYAHYGLSSSNVYAYIADGGSSGLTTVIGQKYLEQYYSVYDTVNKRIGFAPRT